MNIASVCQNIWRGTVNHGPLSTRGKTSIQIRGENSRITSTPHQGFYDKNVTCQLNTNTQSARNGFKCTVCIRFSPTKIKKLGVTLPLTREENNPLFIRGEHTLALRISSRSSQNSHTILEKILTINLQKKAQNGPFASFFQIFSREDHEPPPPPHLLRENKKNPPLLGLYMILYS